MIHGIHLATCKLFVWELHGSVFERKFHLKYLMINCSLYGVNFII